MRTGHGTRLAIAFVATVCVALAAGSCSWKRSVPTRQYYIISYTPEIAIPQESSRPYPYSLQIGRFEVQRIFNRQNIMYRYSPNRIQYYEMERWAVRPDYMMRDVVFKHFEASRLTNHVSQDFLDTKPDYRLEGTVEALEKYDAGDLYYAHLAMTFKMLRVNDGQQLWDYSFDERRRVYADEMVHTVVGLSSILQTHMNTIVGQLDSLFLARSTGRTWTPESIAPVQKNGKETSKPDVDESAFEIIPENRRQ